MSIQRGGGRRVWCVGKQRISLCLLSRNTYQQLSSAASPASSDVCVDLCASEMCVWKCVLVMKWCGVARGMPKNEHTHTRTHTHTQLHRYIDICAHVTYKKRWVCMNLVILYFRPRLRLFNLKNPYKNTRVQLLASFQSCLNRPFAHLAFHE